ncbi:MAG: hypothetical protein ACHQ2F_00680 [Desulfobaccales bacterium]
MFNLLFARPLAALLTVAGAAVLAPVIFPIIGVILKPLVGPVTNLYLDLADEMADAFLEREERKGVIKPGADEAELKRLVEEIAEDKVKLRLDAAATGRLVEKL